MCYVESYLPSGDALDDLLSTSAKPVLVVVSAERCAPCRRLSASLPVLARRFVDAVRIVEVDADADAELDFVSLAGRGAAQPAVVSRRPSRGPNHRSSSPRSNGSTGSTTRDCWSRSETFRRPKPKRAIMRNSTSPPSRRDSNKTASGKHGAVQYDPT